MKITIPAGRYFVGDVSGISKPLVAIPARASVFYSDCGAYEFEIAGGASCMYDEDAFGVFGVVEFSQTGLSDEDFDLEFGVFEVTTPTEIEYDFDYLDISGVLTVSVCREAGLRFTDSDEAFDAFFAESA